MGRTRETTQIIARLSSNTTFGVRLEELREQQGLSQADLATKAEMTRQHLTRLEKGGIYPNATTRRKLAKALGVPVSELVQ